ncbi:hypothetical protein LguiA_026688 [Lonicera macranthoides]
MEDHERDLPIILIHRTASFQDLPTCLVTSILSRLPAKTLISCTSVNKSWYALIKNPKFISIHLNQSIKNGNHYLLLTPEYYSKKSYYCPLISERDFTEESKFEIPFGTCHNAVRVYGSCNGLICLGDQCPNNLGRDIHLWNPFVNKHKHIQSSCYVDLLTNFKDLDKILPVIGFGFHEDDCDFRVLRIFFRLDKNYLGDLEPRVEVYSSRSDSWRRVSANVPRLVNHSKRAFVNGSVYWLAANSKEWIVSFNFKNEVFEEFKLPASFRHGVGRRQIVVLMEFKGLVSVCAFDLTVIGSEPCSVWVRRENGGSVSWFEQFNVVLKVKGWPLMFTKSGKLIMRTIDETKLILYDLENLEFKDFGNIGSFTANVSCMESLSLFEDGNAVFKQAGHGFE